jgi:alpha-galactosidase
MEIKTMGLHREESPLPPDMRGAAWRYRVDENGGERLKPDPGTGALFIDSWSFEELFRIAVPDGEDGFDRAETLAIQCGGWQSWSAGWELAEGETLPRRVRIIPELIKQTNREGDNPGSGGPQDDSAGGDWLIGHFICYIRAGDRYLCLAARDGGAHPPVSYRISRKKRRILAEVFCPGKTWLPGETAAAISLFFVRGFFPLKDALRTLYQQEAVFAGLDFLCRPGPGAAGTAGGAPLGRGKDALPGGYESWYNHYTDINEQLILEDLKGLKTTENLIKGWYMDRGKPAVFQIDDGWENAVGEWEVNSPRFPRGLAPVAVEIEAAGLIPGLWLAPFLVTKRSRLYRERPDWLLRDAGGAPVVAGFNHLWDKRFYCLDLSRREVLEYLDQIMDRVINQWGFRYIKLDFLYAGLLSGAFAEGGSPGEHYERACALLTSRGTSNGGLPVAYLGCGLPLGPSYRHFPLSRIGADTREEWDWPLVKFLGHVGRPGAYVSLMDTIGRSFLDGAVYINDPDVLFLRSRNCKLTEMEKELIALVNFLLAGQLMFSDDPLGLEQADLALTRRIIGLYDRLGGDEYGAVRIDRDVFRLESRSGKTWGIINLSRGPRRLDPAREPALAAALSRGTFLVDHRVKGGTPDLIFEAHSITIAQ